jgi:hypothetical protein
MMAKFSAYVAKTVDLLSNVFQCCKSEAFDEDHVKTMNAIKEPLVKIMDSNAEVLKYCLAGLYEGAFNEDLQAMAKKELASAEAGLKEMTTKLLASRAETGYNKVSKDCSGENVAALTFAKFTYLTREFYDNLQGEQVENNPPTGIMGLFSPDVLFETDHIMWTLRNSFSIIVAFWIGWHGYGQYIASYNAAIASTVAVLLSKFVGSAMVKNLARLQGVVIGIVLGNLLYAFLAWCYWWGHLLVGLALYSWTLLGLFMYFHSTNYATVGLLLAVFGASALCKPCANDETNPAGMSSIVNVTVAIIVMTVVDILMSPARASDIAKENFRNAYTSVLDAFEKLFDPDVKTIQERGDALVGPIGAAETMGNEAALEPRYWRHDWPTGKFDKAISCLKTLRFCVDSIESVMLNEDGTKKDVFIAAIKLKEFSDKATGLKTKLIGHTTKVMEEVEKQIQDLAGNDVFMERLTEIQPDKLKARDTFDEVWRSALIGDEKEAGGYYTALNAPKFRNENIVSAKAKDVGQDPLAECSLLVESLEAMFVVLDETLEKVIS